MRAGRLDRRIDIERPARGTNNEGDPIETWSALAENWPAGYRPLRAEERFTAEQFVAREQAEFRVRYAAVLADLNPLDRIVYPIYTPSESPAEATPDRNVWDIMGVAEIGRREGFLITAARRAEKA